MFIMEQPTHYLYRRQAEEPIGGPLRRPSPAMYDPIPPTDLETAGSDSYHHGGGYKPGIVGPVYTFVKTDPYAHVKWGVRHVAERSTPEDTTRLNLYKYHQILGHSKCDLSQSS